MRRRFVATDAMRSDSLTRSSLASRTSIPWRVNGAIAASTGISSISAAESAPAMVAPFRGFHRALRRPDQFAVNFFELGDGNTQAHLHQDVEQAGARGIHQKMSGMRNCELGNRAAAHRKKAALERSPGMCASMAMSALAAADAAAAIGHTFALHLRSEGAQRDFAMIASADGFFDASLAFGE